MTSKPLAVLVCALTAIGTGCHENSSPATTQAPVPVISSPVSAVGATVTFKGLSGAAR